MKILKVGVTRIVPKKEYGKPHYAYVAGLLGCSQIRERLLKDGSRVVLGYRQKNSKLAEIAVKFSPEDWLQNEHRFSLYEYGDVVRHKSVETVKTLYNKLGDVLKSTEKAKVYENDKLITKRNILTDIVKGVDQSVTEFFEDFSGKYPKGVAKVKKERINPKRYQETITDKSGEVLSDGGYFICGDDSWRY